MKTYLSPLKVTLLLAGLVAGCAHGAHTEATSTTPAAVSAMDHRHPASMKPRLAVLPDQAKWASLYEFADNLDLTDPSIQLKMHNGEGTSVYGVVMKDGKAIGAIIPENSSASVTGETLGWTLSRALGVSEIYQPGVYHFLSGRNLDAFMKIVPNEPIAKNKNKEENRQRILKRYQEQPQGMDAVFKLWDQKPKDLDGINGPNRMINPDYTMDGASAPLASFVKCDGPKPSANRAVSFAGGSSNELAVAKELSVILLIDALEGQWDRFSGGNLQTMILHGEPSLVSIDNGGTWGGKAADGITPTQRNLSMVTRFDRNVAAQILAMDDFFEKGTPYLGLRTRAEFVSAFDIAQAPKTTDKFIANLKVTAAHIRAHEGCYF